MRPFETRAQMHSELVVANRILAHEGVVDAYGHVSCRRPGKDSFLLARSRSPALVREDDLIEYDLAGAAMNGDARAGYVERMIHAAIYAARGDVQAVVHSHAPHILPFTIVDRPLQPVIHVAGMIGAHVPKWDIADRFGDTDLLVRTLAQGADLAATLGAADCALMRGHGAVVTGRSLKESVVRAIFLHMNAAAQLQAAILGPCKALSEAEAGLSAQSHTAGHVLDRAWEYFAARAQGGEASAS